MWVTPEQIEEAKKIDLLTYLRNYEPNNLIKVCAGTYCTREHDSLKISNGVWHWFSRHIGGKNALDYLTKVRGVSFVEAVKLILGYEAVLPPKYSPKAVLPKPRSVEIPKPNSNNEQVKRYLRSRGINSTVIDYCIENNILYEDAEYHNCIFLGYDGNNAKYGAVRSTVSDFKRDLTGSDKRYSFCIDGESDTVHLFESAIDLLSFATLEIKANRNWRKDNLLSLAGVYRTDNKQDIPLALEAYLERNPNTKTIYLHFDNDEIGRTAANQIADSLSDKYEIFDLPPKFGKDYNEYLTEIIRKEKRKENER